MNYQQGHGFTSSIGASNYSAGLSPFQTNCLVQLLAVLSNEILILWNVCHISLINISHSAWISDVVSQNYFINILSEPIENGLLCQGTSPVLANLCCLLYCKPFISAHKATQLPVASSCLFGTETLYIVFPCIFKHSLLHFFAHD